MASARSVILAAAVLAAFFSAYAAETISSLTKDCDKDDMMKRASLGDRCLDAAGVAWDGMRASVLLKKACDAGNEAACAGLPR